MARSCSCEKTQLAPGVERVRRDTLPAGRAEEAEGAARAIARALHQHLALVDGAGAEGLDGELARRGEEAAEGDAPGAGRVEERRGAGAHVEALGGEREGALVEGGEVGVEAAVEALAGELVERHRGSREELRDGLAEAAHELRAAGGGGLAAGAVVKVMGTGR